jgi:hypothetical protein
MTEKIATAVFILMFGFFIFIFLLPAVLFVLLSMTDVARWCSRLLHLYFDKDIRVGWSVVYLISVAIATWIEFGDRIKDQIGDRFSNVAPCPRCKRRALILKIGSGFASTLGGRARTSSPLGITTRHASVVLRIAAGRER